MPSDTQQAIAAASACIWKGDQVLLVLRPEGVWALPGGKVEAGESVLAAAARELYEETGVTARDLRLLKIYDITTPKGLFRLHCHSGFWVEGEAIAATDAIGVRWSLPSELYKLPMPPSVRDAISLSSTLGMR